MSEYTQVNEAKTLNKINFSMDMMTSLLRLNCQDVNKSFVISQAEASKIDANSDNERKTEIFSEMIGLKLDHEHDDYIINFKRNTKI